VSYEPLDPVALLRTLSESGVDFVVIGALAVGVHAEVRATADVDVMLPVGNEENKSRLAEALERMGAYRLPMGLGGVDPAVGDPYSTVSFRTRHGKLDILYRPDGSDQYAQVKQRSLTTSIGGQPVAVAGRDDLVRMKLAAGRPDDLRDVANLNASEQGARRRVRLVMRLASTVAPVWARDLAGERVSLFDPDGRTWVEDRLLQIEAVRTGLTDAQIEQWARALAERLHGAGILVDADVDVDLR